MPVYSNRAIFTTKTTTNVTTSNVKMIAGRKRRATSPAGDTFEPIARRLRSRAALEPIAKRTRSKSPEDQCEHQLPPRSTTPSEMSPSPIDNIAYRTRLRSQALLKDESVLPEKQRRIVSARRSDRSGQQEGERTESPVVPVTTETPNAQTPPPIEVPMEEGVKWAIENDPETGQTGPWRVTYPCTGNEQKWNVSYDLEGGANGKWRVAYPCCSENDQPWSLSYDLEEGVNGTWRISPPCTEQEMEGSPWSMSYEEEGEALRIKLPQSTGSAQQMEGSPWSMSYEEEGEALRIKLPQSTGSAQQMEGSPWSMSYEEEGEALRINLPQSTGSAQQREAFPWNLSFEEVREAYATLRARILRRNFRLSLCPIS